MNIILLRNWLKKNKINLKQFAKDINVPYPTFLKYIYGDKSWRGSKSTLEAIKKLTNGEVDCSSFYAIKAHAITVKDKLRLFLKKNNLTQAAFSDLSGINKTQVSMLCRGVKSIYSLEIVDKVEKTTQGYVKKSDFLKENIYISDQHKKTKEHRTKYSAYIWNNFGFKNNPKFD